MYSIVTTAIVQGIKSVPVSVEADVSDGMPVFEMVGFLAAEVKESRERVRTALRNCGYVLPAKRITINFTPANIRKTGSGFDLPIALSILCAMGVISKESLKDVFVIGEICLNGEVRSVNGILPMISEAKEKGIRRCIVPWENIREAELVKQLEVCPVRNLKEAICFLNMEKESETEGTSCKILYSDENVLKERLTGQSVNIEKGLAEERVCDFAEINGQRMLKRACEMAVSGMHNLLMIGPPGAGKTMTAMRIPTILPTLDESERMELSKIYSVCGLFQQRDALMDKRPFRSPHHTITPQGLVGGGTIPKPGEISLAHKGVLFLDELPEFKKETIETLRQPMEERMARLVRLNGTYEYPADFMLVAAMNPCKCGYYPDMQKCRCSTTSIERYVNRISQPLLDRIDICVTAMQIPFEELTSTYKEETSEEIRERVTETQKRMEYRYRNEDFKFNSQLPSGKIKLYCKLKDSQENYMKEVYKDLNLTARSFHKILKVARTLADMEQVETIEDRHLKEAICYRSIDKKIWK